MDIFSNRNLKIYFHLVTLLFIGISCCVLLHLELSSSKTSTILYRGIVHYSIRQDYKASNITNITTDITITTPIPTPPTTILIIASIAITTPISPTIASNISIPAMKRRMPDIVMIGAAKCGTDAILLMLGMHPNIRLELGEPEFYSYNYHLGLEWYINSMPLVGDDQLLMEKTPNYFYFDEVAQRLHDAKPDTMIILVVIDPVERVMSHFVHVKSVQKFNHTFEEFVIDKNTGQGNTKQPIVDMGLYGKHFRSWVKYFPPEQIIVLNGKLLVQEPWVIMEQIQTFLNVSQFITKNMFTFVEEKKFYCFGVDTHKCLSDTKGRPHPEISPSVRDKLQTFYKESNEEFFKLLKKTNQKVILNWGY